MNRIIMSGALALSLSACVTTGEMSAEERSKCERMAAEMSMASQHDHSEEKGITARSPMNRTHDRCRAMLANADGHRPE
jgi:hypothetical protein